MVPTQRRRRVAGGHQSGTAARPRNLAAALKRYGLLLLQDKALPSAVGVITGATVAGSWWSHPRAHEIFRELEKLDDVLAVKLIAGKVTFIDEQLRQAVAAVGRSREPWQTRGLSVDARWLLDRVDREGSVRATGAASKELQLRLLVNAREVHTESGRHETVLESWPAVNISADDAKRQIEEAAEAIGARDRLPWLTGSDTSGSSASSGVRKNPAVRRAGTRRNRTP